MFMLSLFLWLTHSTSTSSFVLFLQRRQRRFWQEIFDPSLGCPLSSLENATLQLVGGKALSCWRLARHGFPVPTAFIVPTYVYSMHIRDAGCAQLIDNVFKSNLNDESVREVTKTSLATIRERIMATPLNPEVISNLESFLSSLGPGTFVSVRSSGSAEDLASQSFAGQYDTFLYKITKDEIIESIKLCWASMFKDHILDYASSSKDYVPGNLNNPTMGVLIMKMVEAETSGVCFSRNLWGDKKEVMIEAVMGQGEGLVSGVITPDRFVLDKYSSRLCYSEVVTQTQKYVRGNNKDGVELITLNVPKEDPVLSEKQLKSITNLARAIEDFYNAPQDIEWAIDTNGGLYILQSRPITTSENSASLSFLPPGEGFWTFDPTVSLCDCFLDDRSCFLIFRSFHLVSCSIFPDQCRHGCRNIRSSILPRTHADLAASSRRSISGSFMALHLLSQNCSHQRSLRNWNEQAVPTGRKSFMRMIIGNSQIFSVPIARDFTTSFVLWIRRLCLINLWSSILENVTIMLWSFGLFITHTRCHVWQWLVV
jgi:hypothetical protein